MVADSALPMWRCSCILPLSIPASCLSPFLWWELGSSSQGCQSPLWSWLEWGIVPGRCNECSWVILINLSEWSSHPESPSELVSIDGPVQCGIAPARHMVL